MTHGFDTSFLVAAEVEEHPDHAGVWRRLALVREGDGRFGITAPVIAEFVHVVTDARRFAKPLTMTEAITKARMWADAAEVETFTASDAVVAWFLDALARHRLGRKRILDTMLAATYRSAGVASLLTLNAGDFAVFEEFACFGGA